MQLGLQLHLHLEVHLLPRQVLLQLAVHVARLRRRTAAATNRAAAAAAANAATAAAPAAAAHAATAGGATTAALAAREARAAGRTVGRARRAARADALVGRLLPRTLLHEQPVLLQVRLDVLPRRRALALAVHQLRDGLRLGVVYAQRVDRCLEAVV